MKAFRKTVSAITSLCLVGAVLYFGNMLELKLNEYRTALDISTKRTLEMRKGRDVDFEKLKKKNPDVLGWIWLQGTNIDYPIVQGADNDYYLHRDFDGDYLYDGCIFVDAAVEQPFRDFNTVIYGHRMRSGLMFHDLSKYADREFFDKNRVIIIETEERSYDLHVVAFCTDLSDSELYTTDFGDASSYSVSDDEDDLWSGEFDLPDDGSRAMTKADFVDLVRERAVCLSDEDFGTGDTFVTLSTCAYSTGEERNQVIGVLREAPMEERIVETRTKKPLFNKWLLLQIAVGIVMAGTSVLTIVSLVGGGKKKKSTREE